MLPLIAAAGGTRKVSLVRPGVLHPLVQFRRSTPGYGDAGDSALRLSPVDVPRFIGGTRLVIEEPCTNLLVNSQVFNATGWIANGGLAVTADVLAPDGTLTAFRYTSLIELCGLYDHSNSVWLRTGIPFVSVSDRWTRVVNTVTVPENCTMLRAYISRGAGGSPAIYQNVPVTPSQTYTFSFYVRRDAAGTVLYLWGAQVELGAYASAYIPTTSAGPATRATDLATLAFPRLPFGTEGTVLVKAGLYSAAVGNFRALVSFNDGAANDRNSLTIRTGSDGSNLIAVWKNNSTQSAVSTAAPAYPSRFRAAVSWDSTGTSFSLNGSHTASAGIIPSQLFNTAGIGGLLWSATGIANGEIESIQILPRRLPTAALRSWTNLT